MSAPAFFKSDTRRTDYAWNDWEAVAVFLGTQTICRIAVNDGTWPYVVAQAYRFDGETFTINFSRRGKLANCIIADPHCTIEVDQVLRVALDPRERSLSAEYYSVVARCIAEIEELELERDPATGKERRIFAVHARVQTLSAKYRVLAPSQTS